jgi:hypothetical protein
MGVLVEHQDYFKKMYDSIENVRKSVDTFYPYGYLKSKAVYGLNHIKQIIEIERTSEQKIKEIKIFEGATEKLKQAGLCYNNNDYTSAFHNLNTALELALKDKLEIPVTITGIHTSNVIEILSKHRIESHLYLVEAKKHIVLIDNKIKHQGYSPTKIARAHCGM